MRYIIDAKKLGEFEHDAKLWIPLVNRFGSQHHGYFLPSEGANNVAYALFSFPSLALYEQYRIDARRRVLGGLCLGKKHTLHRQLRAQLLTAGV